MLGAILRSAVKSNQNSPHGMIRSPIRSVKILTVTGRYSPSFFTSVKYKDNSQQGLLKYMNYKDIITIEPGKRGGKPCVRGLRITVYEVLEYLASEMSEAEILDDFPDLTREDLKACIAYAADRERRFATTSLSV